MVQDITVDTHVVHEHGHVSALSGGHHFSWGVINADDCRAHFVTGTHQFPGARVDVLAGAEGRPQRRGPGVWAEDPTNSDIPWGGQRRRAEHPTLPCATQPRVAPQEARAASRARRPGPDEKFPVVNEPLAAGALGLEGRGKEVTQMSVSRVAQDGAPVGGTSPCSAPRLVANVAPVRREVTESEWCCHSVQAEASGKCVRRA